MGPYLGERVVEMKVGQCQDKVHQRVISWLQCLKGVEKEIIWVSLYGGTGVAETWKSWLQCLKGVEKEIIWVSLYGGTGVAETWKSWLQCLKGVEKELL